MPNPYAGHSQFKQPPTLSTKTRLKRERYFFVIMKVFWMVSKGIRLGSWSKGVRYRYMGCADRTISGTILNTHACTWVSWVPSQGFTLEIALFLWLTRSLESRSYMFKTTDGGRRNLEFFGLLRRIEFVRERDQKPPMMPFFRNVFMGFQPFISQRWFTYISTHCTTRQLWYD